jgi:hypothetical protein
MTMHVCTTVFSQTALTASGRPLSPSVEAEAFRRMDAWNRQEAARRVRQEELDAASQQPFPGGPLTGTPESGMPGRPGTEVRADFEAEP